MRATKMTKNKENHLRRGAGGQEKEDRRVLVPKVLVGTVEGLIFRVNNLTSMMKPHSTTMELMVPKATQRQR